MFRLYVFVLVVVAGASACSIDDVTRVATPIDRVVIVDVDGRKWDITQAVYGYGFNAGGFTGGLGAFNVVPILNPLMISPGDTNYPETSDTFEVVGVDLGGTARAYGLDTLIVIQVINDVHGQQLSAVVFDPPSMTTSTFERAIDGDAVTLAASGWTYGNQAVLFDYETESLWYRLGTDNGLTCINGERLNSVLDLIPSGRESWDDWNSMHPMSRVFGAPSP